MGVGMEMCQMHNKIIGRNWDQRKDYLLFSNKFRTFTKI